MSRLINIQSDDDHAAAVERLFALLPCPVGTHAELEARLIQLAIDRFERAAALAIELRLLKRLH